MREMSCLVKQSSHELICPVKNINSLYGLQVDTLANNICKSILL